jgi:hypothetical protein
MFGRKKKENKKGRKPLETFFVRYIGYLGTNKMIPSDQDIYLHILEEGIYIQFLNLKGNLKGTHIEIPYIKMMDIQNMDGGDKVDADRVLTLGLLAGYLWKKHHTITIIKYNDNAEKEPQQVALDLGNGLQKIQPLIYDKMQKAMADNN